MSSSTSFLFLPSSVSGSPSASAGNNNAKDSSKKEKNKKKGKKKRKLGADAEAGEETDEGDMESREVDYITDSSNNSDHEFEVCIHVSMFVFHL